LSDPVLVGGLDAAPTREAAIAERQGIAFGLGDPEWMARILEQTDALAER
jgi:hypothetical protein